MREPILTKAVIADPKSRYGNGKSATRHFLVQRLTGASNLVFIVFLVSIVMTVSGGGRGDVVSVIGNPIVGLPFALLFAIVCVHMRIGMREIIEDYVHDHRTNRLALTLNTMFCLFVALAGAGAVLAIVFLA